MSRAYIRLDPAFDEKKEGYPDGPYAALVACFCLAESQTNRGYFRSLTYLQALLGRRGRHAKYLVDHGDLVILPDGRVYIDGWEEWQEGDWKVNERVDRIRNRQRRTVGVTVGGQTPVTVSTVTTTVTPVTPPVTADRLDIAERSVSNSGAEAEPDEWPALQWLSQWGCEIRPGNGYHRKLVTAVEVHGVEAIVATFERLAKAGVKRGDIKGFVFGAIDALNEPSRPKLRAVEAAASHDRGVERTKIRAHENGFHETPNPGCPRCAA